MLQKTRILYVCLFVLISSTARADGEYIAFSLGEAQRIAQSGSHADPELKRLAGINRIVGMVFDYDTRDIILVGRKISGYPEATLDDLVTALRSRLKHDRWPLVSIDPTEDSPSTLKQSVTFQGGIRGTSFGKSFFDSDVILKNYSLELLPSSAWAPSYASLCLQDYKDRIISQNIEVLDARWIPLEKTQELSGHGIVEEDVFQVRFWFFPVEPILFASREGVFCIKELKLGVSAEMAFLPGSRSRGQMHASVAYAPADSFAQNFSRNFWKLAGIYKQLKSLKVLYDMVAVANGIRNLDRPLDLDYFINDYSLSAVSTPREHEFVIKCALIQRSDGKQHAIQIAGGIEFNTKLKWMNAGDITPLREFVVQTRPDASALWWHLPLEEWKMPNSQDLEEASWLPSTRAANPQSSVRQKLGTCVQVQSYLLESGSGTQLSNAKTFNGFTSPELLHAASLPERPHARYFDSLDPAGVEIFIPEKPVSKDADMNDAKKDILRSKKSKDTPYWDLKKKDDKKKKKNQ